MYMVENQDSFGFPAEKSRMTDGMGRQKSVDGVIRRFHRAGNGSIVRPFRWMPMWRFQAVWLFRRYPAWRVYCHG